jgi:hypothetical protein
MVAGRVDLNPSGNSLICRQTTLLPNVAHLGPILLMIFAPRVELRLSQNRTRFTGCLTGLGDREEFWGVTSRTEKKVRGPFLTSPLGANCDPQG